MIWHHVYNKEAKMKRYAFKGYILFLIGCFVTLLSLHHILVHNHLFHKVHGSDFIIILGFVIAFWGAYLVNHRSYQKYDHIERARILREGRGYIIEWPKNQPRLNYEAILIQALSFIHKSPNKSAQELFDDNYNEISELYSAMPEYMWDEYIRELKMCLRSYR